MTLVDSAFMERAILLALIAAHYEAHIVPVTDPEPGFTRALCIHIRGRQHAWHISDEDLIFFQNLPHDAESHYDGHTTDEKYQSLWSHAVSMRSSV